MSRLNKDENRVRLIEPIHPIHLKARIVRILSGLNQAVWEIFGYDITGKEKHMGIELGSVGAAIGSVATGIGKAGAGAAPAVASFGGLKGFGGLEGLAPAGLSALPDVGGIAGPLGEFKASVPIASFGEGPVRGGFLEGFKTMNASDITSINKGGAIASSPLGEILFKAPSEPAVISQAETVAAVAWENSRVPVWEVFASEAKPMAIMSPARIATQSVAGGPALEPQTGTQIKTENKVSTGPAIEATPTILTQPAPAEQEVEEIVEEKVDKQEPEERLEEEEEIERQMYLEDENASTQRRIEVRTAVAKASLETDRLGLKKIAGWLVAKFLPSEHEGNRSQVVKKTGPDGSYQETVEAITGAGEFESGEKAVERFDGIVAEKKPVKFGKNGNPVGNIDVARVFRYRLIKPIQVHEEVVKRVVKKKVLVAQQTATPVVASEKKEVKAETNLEELSPALADVFQKAA